jgi:hypothetical protein
MSLKRVPRQRIYKDEDIYQCMACAGMYTTDYIDEHIEKCSKMEAWEKQRAAELAEEEAAELAEEEAAELAAEEAAAELAAEEAAAELAAEEAAAELAEEEAAVAAELAKEEEEDENE